MRFRSVRQYPRHIYGLDKETNFCLGKRPLPAGKAFRIALSLGSVILRNDKKDSRFMGENVKETPVRPFSHKLRHSLEDRPV